jgi:DNA-binding GntR family transcriptional regulator
MDLGQLNLANTTSMIKDSVAAHLRNAIITGELEAGEPIVEGRWAKRLGIAQSSVRAALTILESEGFVERGKGRSLTVTLMKPEDIVHTFQVRTALEAFSARLVAARQPDLSELEQIIADMRSAVACSNLQAFYERDLRFHLTLCRLAGNPVLEQFLQRLLVPLFAFVIMKTHDTLDDANGRWTGSIAKHARIVEVLRKADPELAAREVSSIVDYFSGDIRELTLRKTQDPG